MPILAQNYITNRYVEAPTQTPTGSIAFGIHEVVETPSSETLELPLRHDDQSTLILKREQLITERHVENAYRETVAPGKYMIHVNLTSDGGLALLQHTREIDGSRLAVVANDTILVAPIVRSALGSSFVIDGSRLTDDEADDLVARLNKLSD